MNSKPIFIKRESMKLEKSQSVVNEFKKILLEKKQTKTLADSGFNIAVNPFIDMIANQEIDLSGKFQDIQTAKGGLVILMCDLSGSMRNYPEIRNVLYNLFLAIEEINEIDFEIVGFSCHQSEPISYIDIIKTPKECSRIHQDEIRLHDRLDLALEYAIERIKNYSDGKASVLIISDGLPEGEKSGRKISTQTLIDYTRQQLTRLSSMKINTFAIFLGKNTDSRLVPMFRNNVYFTKNLDVGIRKLVIEINKFLRFGY